MAIGWQVFPWDCLYHWNTAETGYYVYLKNIYITIFKEILLDLPGKIPEMQMWEWFNVMHCDSARIRERLKGGSFSFCNTLLIKVFFQITFHLFLQVGYLSLMVSWKEWCLITACSCYLCSLVKPLACSVLWWNKNHTKSTPNLELF